MTVGQNQWYHFGVGAPPILVYIRGDWDVHWGYGILTHGQMTCPWPTKSDRRGAQRKEHPSHLPAAHKATSCLVETRSRRESNLSCPCRLDSLWFGSIVGFVCVARSGWVVCCLSMMLLVDLVVG